MGFHRARGLATAAFLPLLFAAGTAVATVSPAPSQFDPEPVDLEAVFVVYERPHVGVDNLGPIDLASLFHPGGTGGGDNLPCTPDRLTIETNQIRLTYDPATGAVTGTGTIVVRCQFHIGEGCEAEQRTVGVDFATGLFDPATLQMIGNVTVGSEDRIVQDWGNSDVKDPASCTWGTTNLGPVGPYAQQWRLDLSTDPASGWVASDVATGDPAQRSGFFEVSNPSALEQVVTLATVDEPESGSAGDAPAVVSNVGDQADTASGEVAGAQANDSGVRSPGVFGPVADGDEDVNSLWFNFFMIFVFLAAVFLFGRPLLRRFRQFRSDDR